MRVSVATTSLELWKGRTAIFPATRALFDTPTENRSPRDVITMRNHIELTKYSKVGLPFEISYTFLNTASAHH